jgi:hypothetical protein
MICQRGDEKGTEAEKERDHLHARYELPGASPLPTSVAEDLIRIGRNDRRPDHAGLIFVTVPEAGTTFDPTI